MAFDFDQEPVEETLARAPVERRVWRVTLHFADKRDLYTQFDERQKRDIFVAQMLDLQDHEDAWVFLDDGGVRAKFVIAYTLTDYAR